MAAALALVKEEWRHFRDDPPGERFRKHRDRMKKRSKAYMAVSTALGVLLLAGGVVLLFIPGPGLLLIVFGLALVGSHSGRISDAMDRAEPALRQRAHRAKHWWQGLSRATKGGLIAATGVVALLAMLGMWRGAVAAGLL